MTDETQNVQNLRILEAVLFSATEPVAPDALLKLFPEGTNVPGLVEELRAEYAGRGVNVVERDGRYAFRTAPDLANVLRVETDVKKNLSRVAVETLAIVAYHQPVTRAEIENIRGVAISKGTLDALMEAGWVRPGRRRATPGKPLTWVTTPAFLDYFGLESLADLPRLDELKTSGLLDTRPAIAAFPGAKDMFSGEGEGEAETDSDDDMGDEDGEV